MPNEHYSLQDVEKHFSGYNLLLPQSTDVQLSPFYSFHVEVVPCNTDPQAGDIFKVGSVNTGQKDRSGKDIWADVFSLTKPMLNKLAMAAGIQFNPDQTYGMRVDQYTYRAKAQGAMRKSDGTSRTETDQKEICLKDEEDKYRIEFMDKASQGISDARAAKDAAKLFQGKWVKMQDKWGKSVDGFLIDESDRDRYIERSVMVNMALLRKTWAEKAMTGAKLRVIRALLGLKGTYTAAELAKGFAIPTVVFSPDYNDPMVRQAMLSTGINGVANMFGGGNVPVRQISFDAEPAYDIDADLDSPAFQSDMPEEDFTDDYRQPEEPEQLPQADEYYQQPPQDGGYQQEPRQMQSRGSLGPVCEICGKGITQKVAEFSNRKYQRALCMDCQKGGRG